MGFFFWRGEPITDIKNWCKEHNTKMIKLRKVRNRPTVLDCVTKNDIEQEPIEIVEMPEEFWNTLRQSSTDFYRYEELK